MVVQVDDEDDAPVWAVLEAPDDEAALKAKRAALAKRERELEERAAAATAREAALLEREQVRGWAGLGARLLACRSARVRLLLPARARPQQGTASSTTACNHCPEPHGPFNCTPFQAIAAEGARLRAARAGLNRGNAELTGLAALLGGKLSAASSTLNAQAEVRWVLAFGIARLALLTPAGLALLGASCQTTTRACSHILAAAPQLLDRQSCQALHEAQAAINRNSELEARREALLHLRAQLASKAQVGATRRWLVVV